MRYGMGLSPRPMRSAQARQSAAVLVGSNRFVRQLVGASALLFRVATGTLYIGDDERDARDGERKAQARIEEGDEPFGQHAAHAQCDAATHHDCHDDIALTVEKVPDVFAVFFKPADALRMLAHKLLEHEHVEEDEDYQREREHPPHEVIVRDDAHTDVGDIAARHNPNDAGDQKELFGRDFHGRDYKPFAAEWRGWGPSRAVMRETNGFAFPRTSLWLCVNDARLRCKPLAFSQPVHRACAHGYARKALCPPKASRPADNMPYVPVSTEGAIAP